MTSTSTRRGAAHPDPEVLIVGAGPTGLTLANELARYWQAARAGQQLRAGPVRQARPHVNP
jgi:ribulose 1,5-bisphosphate synthetase/thiazole synthase